LNRIFGWLVEASPQQKRTLLAASLGWMLDSMDVMLYALVLGQVQRAMHLSAALSGAMMSATLVSAAVGGIAFGWFANRFGPARPHHQHAGLLHCHCALQPHPHAL
jgi:MFS family permease